MARQVRCSGATGECDDLDFSVWRPLFGWLKGFEKYVCKESFCGAFCVLAENPVKVRAYRSLSPVLV